MKKKSSSSCGGCKKSLIKLEINRGLKCRCNCQFQCPHLSDVSLPTHTPQNIQNGIFRFLETLQPVYCHGAIVEGLPNLLQYKFPISKHWLGAFMALFFSTQNHMAIWRCHLLAVVEYHSLQISSVNVAAMNLHLICPTPSP